MDPSHPCKFFRQIRICPTDKGFIAWQTHLWNSALMLNTLLIDSSPLFSVWQFKQISQFHIKDPTVSKSNPFTQSINLFCFRFLLPDIFYSSKCCFKIYTVAQCLECAKIAAQGLAQKCKQPRAGSGCPGIEFRSGKSAQSWPLFSKKGLQPALPSPPSPPSSVVTNLPFPAACGNTGRPVHVHALISCQNGIKALLWHSWTGAPAEMGVWVVP